MNKIKRDSILYIGICILLIATSISISHRQFSLNQDYRIRATDFSIVWYTCFLFLLPLLVKIAFYKLNLQERFIKVFNAHLIIAIITSIIPIYIMFDESSVKPAKEDYSFNFKSDIYLFYVFCKLCVIVSTAIILILFIYQLGLRYYKKYSL